MIDVYLAVPYSHPDKNVRQYRFEQVTKKAGELIEQGLIVYSPITHNHLIAERHDLQTGFDFWRKSDLIFLKLSLSLFVLQLPGWRESEGVKVEIEFAWGHNINVVYIQK